MQRVRRKDFKDEQWPKIQSPNNFVRRTVRRVFDVERPGCPGNKLVANSVTFYLESDKTLPQKESEREREEEGSAFPNKAHTDKTESITSHKHIGREQKTNRETVRGGEREYSLSFAPSIQRQDMTEEGQIDSLKYHSATVLVSSFVSVSCLHILPRGATLLHWGGVQGLPCRQTVLIGCVKCGQNPKFPNLCGRRASMDFGKFLFSLYSLPKLKKHNPGILTDLV